MSTLVGGNVWRCSTAGLQVERPFQEVVTIGTRLFIQRMVSVVKLNTLRARTHCNVILRIRQRNPFFVMQSILKKRRAGPSSFAYEPGSAQAFAFRVACSFAMSAVFLACAMRDESEETTYSIVDCGPLMNTNAANLLSIASRIAPFPHSSYAPRKRLCFCQYQRVQAEGPNLSADR